MVSVVVPCHQRFSYVKECLDSVAEQSHTNLQVIVVDDCSEPGKLEKVIQETKWKSSTKVEYLRSEERLGPGRARELGRQWVQGDFVSYLDSDDIWHPDFISKHLANFEINSTAGMSYCISTVFAHLPLKGNEPVYRQSDEYFETFFPEKKKRRPWATAGCLWTRRAVDLVGSWCESWIGEDFAYDFVARSYDIKVIHLPEVLSHVRRVEGAGHVTQIENRDMWQNSSQSSDFIVEVLRAKKAKMDADLIEWLVTKSYRESAVFLEMGLIEQADLSFKRAIKVRKMFGSYGIVKE